MLLALYAALMTMALGVQSKTLSVGSWFAFDRTIGKTPVVKAGSVGMPFGEPGRLAPPWTDVEVRHTSYDLARAAERIRATSYPEGFAARYLLNPPTATQMLDALTTVSRRRDAGR